MAVLDELDWSAVRDHYDQRISVHRRLLQLHKRRDHAAFADLVLGISDAAGNYSAAEHHLGPKILATNGARARERVFDLGTQFVGLRSAREVPSLIRAADLRSLKIGVGSEASCLLNPKHCWVANTRTIWTHLVIKHDDNIAKADKELRLYRDDDIDSEMHYQAWTDIHQKLDVGLTRIAEGGAGRARKVDVEPGELTYLWADAIANSLYAAHHS
jgi:hypothetical protein